MWKLTPAGKKYNTLPKDHFPAKLKELCEALKSENLIAGFEACGLVPLNRVKVLQRLPSKKIPENVSATAVNNVIIEHLQALRGSKDTSGPSKRRRQKLNVIPGKSVGVDGADGSLSDDDERYEDYTKLYCERKEETANK